MNDDKLGRAYEALDVIEKIGPILHGRDPAVQGAALATLLVTYLMGFQDPEVRREITEMHFEKVREGLAGRDTILQ